MIDLLIAKRASLELKDENGTRPIAFAAGEGSKAIVEYFYNRGANIRATAGQEKTPLICSAIGGRVGTARWLLDHGAKISEYNNDKRTALHFAAWWGHVEVLDLLINTSLSSAIDYQAHTQETLSTSQQRAQQGRSLADNVQSYCWKPVRKQSCGTNGVTRHCIMLLSSEV